MVIAMDLEEKRKRFKDFMRSDLFTLTTFAYLNLVSNNIKLMVDLIRLEGVLYDKVEKCEISYSGSEEARTSIKHLIHLDALSKIMMILETFFALAQALLGDYKDISAKMMKYHQRNIDKFVREIIKKRLDKGQIWKIAGFPSLEKLNLNMGEEDAVAKVLERSANDIADFLRRLAQFYLDHKSLYNRFKHGFSMMVGFQNPQDKIGIAMALDRKTNFQGRFLRATEGLLLEGLDWFNLLSLLPHTSPTFEYYSKILNDLTLVPYEMIQNHLSYGYNLGEDYLPQKIISERPIPESDFRLFQQIADRLRPNMYYIEKPVFNVIFDFKADKVAKLQKAFAENYVANLWVLTTNDLMKSVESYFRNGQIFDLETVQTITAELEKAAAAEKQGKQSFEEMKKLIDFVESNTHIEENAKEALLSKLRSFTEEPFKSKGKVEIEHKITDTAKR